MPTLLEPALIIGLGIVVAGMIVSILMALPGANDLVFWEPARGEMIAAVHGIPGNRSAGLPTEIDF